MRKAPTLALILGTALVAQPTTSAAAPSAERLAQPVTAPAAGISRALHPTPASGRVTVSVRLSNPVNFGPAAVNAEQTAFMQRILQLPGARLVARTQHVLNAVFIEIDASQMATVAADPSVSRVTEVGNYELDLSETVPYIGASAVQAAGVDGTGVTVAVFDSGIDYLHADLGGSGSVADYNANDRNVVEPGSFPTAKVVGGFDFVGEVWPTNGPLQPDPDPLDFEGHGTHVADIIGGVNGVAPGVSLYAVKVCSAISPSCSGVALIQGMDFAADPNGDGDTSDHVDIINMSLGSVYGQPFDDDLVAAVENATGIGILTVASAGNSGDNPYATGTPAASETAISVAQTNVPSAVQDQMEVTAPAAAAGLYPAVFQPWSVPQTAPISGPVQYGDGAGGNLNGCAAFAPGSLAGKIVFVDRGACNFSLKISNISVAGGALGIIGVIDGTAPFPGGDGGDRPIDIPGYMIGLAAGNILRAGNASVVFDPANGLALAGSMVSSSSRGPRNGDNLLKPEIGAPGASVSAQATTGTTRTPFGGTSGAAPMVSGAAALLKESLPWAYPWLLKARLMNNADTMVARDFTGVAAEVSRIGAGEVNVNRSFNSKVTVLSFPGGVPEISMGYEPITRSRLVISKQIEIINDEQFGRRFDVTSGFRFADDAASGAIEIRHPSRVFVAGGGIRRFTVRFIINGDNLPLSQMNSAGNGNNPAALTATEFDGYITLSDSIDSVDVPWHIIPRKSADVRAPRRLRLQNGSANVNIRNRGVGPANNDAFNLLAISEDIPSGGLGAQAPTPDIKAAGIRTTPVPAGFCGAAESFLVEFAFTSWEPQTHVLPVIFQANIDLNNDGTFDYSAFNGDFGQFFGTGIDGRSVSIAEDVAAGTIGVFFFANHATNTTNTTITFCAEQLGMTAADLGTKDITVSFQTFDFYFGGPGDLTDPVTFTVGGGYSATVPDLDPGTSGTMTVTDNGGTNPDLGIMLLTDGFRGATNSGGSVERSEALFLTRPGVQRPQGF